MKLFPSVLLALGILPALACVSHQHADEPPDRLVTIALTGLK